MSVNMKGASGTKKGKTSWMKRGKAAQNAHVEEDAKIAAQQEAAGKLWRFRIPPDRLGEDFSITFLDGDLNDEGMFNIPSFREHTVMHNGKWANYPCTVDLEPCPICEAGDSPSLVGVCTVIDHTPFTIKKGPNAGKTVTDSKRLFVMKPTTHKLLTKIAKKRGGLAGCTFEVTRSTGMEPAVGSMFEFEEKRTLKELGKLFKDKDGKSMASPADYENEIVYLDAEQLIKMGVGTAVGSVGGHSEPVDDDDELGDEL